LVVFAVVFVGFVVVAAPVVVDYIQVKEEEEIVKLLLPHLLSGGAPYIIAISLCEFIFISL
jgi:hypothetical protein